MLDLDERKALHGEAYVRAYEKKSSARVERLIKLMDLRSSDTVADLGCGNAMLLDLIGRRVAQYIGVDFSEQFVAAARSRADRLGASNASFFCGRIQDFCADNVGKIDVCFALDLSEHVYDDEWAEIVSGIHKCIRPGGRVYLHTPNLHFFIERMKDANLFLRQFPEHIAVRSAEKNAEFFHKAGFSEVDVRILPHYNLLRYIHPLSYLPIVGRLFAARIFLIATK